MPLTATQIKFLLSYVPGAGLISSIAGMVSGSIWPTDPRLTAALDSARLVCLADAAHISDAQKENFREFIDGIETAAKQNADATEDGIKALGDLEAFRGQVDTTAPGLIQRVLAAAGPLTDALKLETDRLAKVAGSARETIATAFEASGLRRAEAEVATLEELRRVFAGDVQKRASALAELGADAMNAAAAALGPDRLTDLIAALHPPVKGLLDGSVISPVELAGVLDGLLAGNTAALAGLVETGCGRDPAKIKDLSVAFPKDSEEQKNLSGLMAEGGFARCPQALGPIFAIGCEGQPGKLAMLAAAYKDPGDRKNLTGLLEKGGMGAAPDAFGHVIKTAGVDKAKALGTAFTGDTDLAKLNDMVTKGGLGGGTARRPDALASILKDGVTDPGDLKAHYDGFGSGGMDGFRAMLSAFDPDPPPSTVGPAFAHVASRTCPPADGLKSRFFDTVDKGNSMAVARGVQADVMRLPAVSGMFDKTTGATDPGSLAAMGATMDGAAALVALEGVPGLDPALKPLVAAAVAAMGDAAGTMAGVARLTADAPAAKSAAEAALRDELLKQGKTADAPALLLAAGQAKTAAELARDAATLAAQTLTATSPKTDLLLNTARTAAADALAKAALCPDDTVRGQALVAAQACVDAIRTALAALAATARSEAAANAATEGKARGKDVGDQLPLVDAARSALKLAQTALDTAVTSGNPAAGTPAFLQLQTDVADRQNDLTLAQGLRDTQLAAMDKAADQAARAALADVAAADPAIQAAQLEAARLAAWAARPDATPEDRQAALEAATKAGKLLATKAIGDTTGAVGAIASPPATPTTILMVPTSDGDALYQAAVKLKAAMSATLDLSDRAAEALRAQQRIATDLRAKANLPGATPAEIDKADKAEQKIAVLKQDVADARTQAGTLASQAKALDAKINKNVKLHIKRLQELIAIAAPNPEIPNQTAVRDQIVAAAALCASIVKRAYSASFPAMDRDQVMGISATMKKTPVPVTETGATVISPDCKADTEHFCGRHTTEFFGFEGRDFFPEDDLMDEAIKRAISGNTDFNFPLNMMKTTSLWPPAFREGDIRACLALAITAVEVAVATTVRAHLDTISTGKKQFTGIAITYGGENYTVNIAFTKDTSTTTAYTVGQFVPTSTPSVPFFDMHSVKKAMAF